MSPSDGLDLSQLDPTVQFFCEKGIAESTHKTYQSALRRFASFCSLYSIVTPFPVSEPLLCYYASYLATQPLTPQTIKTYLSAIRYMQVILGLPEPREFSSLPRLRLVQTGIQRTHSQRASSPPRIRLPVTPAILARIRDLWSTKSSDPDIIMLWAAASLCFFGVFRSGELTVPQARSFDPSVHLSWGDIAVDNPEKPTAIRVHLKRSKCDQIGKGVDVFVGQTHTPICPVTAVMAYIAIRGSSKGSFFHLASGQPLTKATFVAKFRQALQAIGLPYQDFAGHSFRIGAATAAAKAGIEDSVIRTLGRWNSAAFLTYIRTPRDNLARLSSRKAS